MKTLSEAMEGLLRRGFTEHFAVRGDQLRWLEGGKTFGPDDVTIREYERFEGVSDPDDMAVLYAIESRAERVGRSSTPSVFTPIRDSAYLGRVPFAGAAHEAGARRLVAAVRRAGCITSGGPLTEQSRADALASRRSPLRPAPPVY